MYLSKIYMHPVTPAGTVHAFSGYPGKMPIGGKPGGRADIVQHIRVRVFEGRIIYEVKFPGKSCVFLRGGWCSIHETKPIVCRNFLCLKAIELKATYNW